MNQKCRTGWLYSSWKNLSGEKISLGNFFCRRPECGCTRKYFAHIFCLAELLLCHLCLFLRTGQIWQFSVLYSNSRSEQTTTVNKHSFTFLFRDICKEHLLWEHVMSYCNGERHFQDWGGISGYGLPAGEKPCTAAGCWQTMPTSKPQL